MIRYLKLCCLSLARVFDHEMSKEIIYFLSCFEGIKRRYARRLYTITFSVIATTLIIIPNSECVLATFRTILALSSIHHDHHLLPVDALKSSWKRFRTTKAAPSILIKIYRKRALLVFGRC